MAVSGAHSGENGKLPFPGMSDLNARLRRIVAAFQKNHKKELMKQEQNEKVCLIIHFLWQTIVELNIK